MSSSVYPLYDVRTWFGVSCSQVSLLRQGPLLLSTLPWLRQPQLWAIPLEVLGRARPGALTPGRGAAAVWYATPIGDMPGARSPGLGHPVLLEPDTILSP